MERTVTGTIRNRNRRPVANALVQIFDEGLRSSSFLGEAKTNRSGAYRITYTADELYRVVDSGRAVPEPVNLIVRVFNSGGQALGESDIRHGAGREEIIDVTAGPPDRTRLSELEQIKTKLAEQGANPVIGELTDDEAAFLARATGIELERITQLRQAHQLADDLQISHELIYASLRQRVVPDEDGLFNDPERFGHAVEQAIEEHIVPATARRSLLAAKARLQALLDQRNAERRARFISIQAVGKLVNADTGDALIGYMVRSTDADENPPNELGYTVSNHEGLFGITVNWPPETPEEERRKTVKLTVSDPNGTEVHREEEVEVKADSDKLITVRVPVVIEQPESPELTSLNVELPEPLGQALDHENIRTLADVRKLGGLRNWLSKQEAPVISPEHDAVRTLDAHARLNAVSTDIEVDKALIERGIVDPGSMAATPRSRVVEAAHERLGDVRAMEMYIRGHARDKIINNVATTLSIESANSVEIDPALKPFDYGTLFHPPKCGCKDCEAAVSPLAYLADLLDYAIDHVEDGNEAITMGFLESNFHQPFGRLPADCEEVDNKVRQVRICIEVLRRYLDAKNLPSGAFAKAKLANAERAYALDAYTTLLIKFGASYEEIRLSRTASTDDRDALAERLGIDLSPGRPDELDELFLDASADPTAITENALEELFGLIDTTRDPLSDGPEPKLKTWRLAYLRTLWRKQDWPDLPQPETVPNIDPDVIGPADIVNQQPGDPAFDLWQARQQEVGQTRFDLKTEREAAATDLDGLETIIADTFQPKTVQDLVDLQQSYDDGEDIEPELTGLQLSLAALKYLLKIRELAPSQNPVLASEWGEVYDILTQVYKRRQYNQWRDEEQQADVFLGPDHFKLRTPPPVSSPPEEPPPLPKWRATERARQDWEDRLRARIEQEQSVVDGFKTAVSETEEEVLPQLRDALVWAATQTVSGALPTKAKWLADRLLIDTQTDGCQQTTRIAQAIETMQGLLWSIRNRLLNDTYPNLDLNDDNFDEAWKWLGSYATWRTAMFVFLYPENILMPHLRRHQTPAFRRLVSEIHKDRRLTPKRAREAAARYAEYFNDITNLTPQASCQTRTRVFEDGIPKGYTYKFYVFAKGGETGKIYWSAYDPADSSDFAQTFWAEVPGSLDVVDVAGAVPYEGPGGDRHIYVFVRVQQKGEEKLVFVRYNLETLRWEGEETELELPENKDQAFHILVRHTFQEDKPPQLVIHMLPQGSIYVRRLARSGEDWEDDEWRLLLGPALGKQLRLQAFLEFETDNACLIVNDSGNLSYRFLGSYDDEHHGRRAQGGQYDLIGKYDDGNWHPIATGTYFGAFVYPGFDGVFVYYKNGVENRYALITPGARNQWNEFGPDKDNGVTWEEARKELNDWFISAAGADLREIASEQGAYADINLFRLLTESNWTKLTGYLEKVERTAVRTHYAFWLQEKAREAEYADEKFGSWRLAEWIMVGLGDPPFEHKQLNIHDALRFLDPPTKIAKRAADNIEDYPTNQDWSGILPAAGNAPAGESQYCYWLKGKAGLYRGQWKSDPRQGLSSTTRIAPRLIFDLYPNERMDEKELQKLRGITKLHLETNQGGPRSNLTYLEEAYYFVSIECALGLQRRGHYTSALDWFRTVYDYSMPPSQRKIYYGLEDAWAVPFSFERAEDWLLDPLNPHEIAASRQYTYLRFTKLAIIRCLLDYANTEFTRDTAESVPRARLLYLTVLELLDNPKLRQSTQRCSDVIGSLDIEVGDPYWQPVVNDLKRELARIDDPVLIEATAQSVNEALNGSGKWPVKFAEARQRIARNTPAPASRASMNNLLEERHKTRAAIGAAMESIEAVANSADRAAVHAARDFRSALSVASGVRTDALENDVIEMPVFRKKLRPDGRAGGGSGREKLTPSQMRSDYLELTEYNRLAPSPTAQLAKNAQGNLVKATKSGFRFEYVPAPSFSFCIPANPVLKALRLQAEMNLYKLRTCRSIAGMKRELEPYAAPTDTVSGLPTIGAGGQLVLPGLNVLKPTPYRYSVIIERAKQLVGLAQQIEAALLSAIEKGDAERYNLLRARQDVQMARGGVRLQGLRVKEAQDGVKLAELQKARAQIQVDTYQEWLDGGKSFLEAQALQHAMMSVALYVAASATPSGPFSAGSMLSAGAAGASTLSGFFSQLASYERRAQEWEFQRTLAQQDVRIGAQQVKIAEDHVRVVEQERVIAEMQLEHAREVVDFLSNKFTNVELYDWMSNVLEGVYAYFLQKCTAMAQIAAVQLAFQRQETPPPFIQADYWEAPDDYFSWSEDGKAPDRRGLTGSARLLQDIHQLDQYAFDTDQRKLQLTKTISLAQMAPAEFQRFRETGIMVFATPMELFDRDFPGHYLRLIKRVRTSVIALIPPIQGIHATLSTTGTSRVVVGGNIFQEVIVNHGPQSVALTSPREATGLFELDTQPEMRLTFEDLGVDTTWEFRMPKASNFFDFNTIADVLITIEYTALNSFDYRQQVIQELDNRINADRAFSFRHQFADQWYHLHNPKQMKEPMKVGFDTRRADFPPNIENLKIQHVVLYFARKDGGLFEVPVAHLHFTEQAAVGTVGGGAMSTDGVISTRRGNAGSWTAMLGKLPIGEWELALPDTQEVKNRFKNEDIEDILFVITYSGRTPEWPA